MKYIRVLALCLAYSLLSSCSAGPNYFKPKTVLPSNFKESAGWKLATPKDLVARGNWWEMFCDSELNRLEDMVDINNQTIKGAEARVRQSRAIVAEARSDYFPSITANIGSTRSGKGGGTSTIVNGNGTSATVSNSSISNSHNASVGVLWDIDVWGKIRRNVEAGEASAAASEADLAAARLSAQGDVAINYLSLRVADEQLRFLNETVEAYKKSLELTQNLYTTGIQARSDYLQAKVQLQSAQAQAVDVGIQRTAYEHALAVLIGKAPSELSLVPSLTVPSVPLPPLTQPSVVLERRPDIAAAERRVAAANANIGLAEAAFYPDLTLSASGGYVSSAFANWFSAPARVWSIGPSIVQTVFDAGLRHAQTQQAIGVYDEAVANYRQAVLVAFQEVEDNLSAMRILREEQEMRNAAHQDARESTDVFLNQYKAGITSYLNVVNAQTIELNNALAALAVKKLRLVADVNLIKALGGKWDIATIEPAQTASAPVVTNIIPVPVNTAPAQASAVVNQPQNTLILTPPKQPQVN